MEGQLESYIREARRTGLTDEQIRKELLAVGWPELQVDSAFVGEASKLNVPTSPAPAEPVTQSPTGTPAPSESTVPTAVPVTEPAPTTPIASPKQYEETPAAKPKKRRWLWAVVAVILLLILGAGLTLAGLFRTGVDFIQEGTTTEGVEVGLLHDYRSSDGTVSFKYPDGWRVVTLGQLLGLGDSEGSPEVNSVHLVFTEGDYQAATAEISRQKEAGGGEFDDLFNLIYSVSARAQLSILLRPYEAGEASDAERSAFAREIIKESLKTVYNNADGSITFDSEATVDENKITASGFNQWNGYSVVTGFEDKPILVTALIGSRGVVLISFKDATSITRLSSGQKAVLESLSLN